MVCVFEECEHYNQCHCFRIRLILSKPENSVLILFCIFRISLSISMPNPKNVKVRSVFMEHFLFMRFFEVIMKSQQPRLTSSKSFKSAEQSEHIRFPQVQFIKTKDIIKRIKPNIFVILIFTLRKKKCVTINFFLNFLC